MVDFSSRELHLVRVELLSRHKAYLAVLGVAGAALLVDRLFLQGVSTPASANASVPTPPAQDSKPKQEVVQLSTQRPSLASRMDTLRSVAALPPEAEAPNAFAPEWVISDATSNARTSASPEESWDWLKLTSVVPGHAAVLNGVVLFVGKEQQVAAQASENARRDVRSRKDLRTITLLSADERKVRVRVEGKEIELMLPDPGDMQTPRASDDSGVVVSPTDSRDK